MTVTTLAEDQRSRAIQALGWGTVENLAFTSGASASSAALSSQTRVVRVCSDVDVWLAIGDAPTAAAASGIRLPAGVVEYVRVTPGLATPKLAARGVAASGTLNIVQCDV